MGINRDAKSEVVNARLTHDERMSFYILAEKKRISPSKFIRRLILNELKQNGVTYEE